MEFENGGIVFTAQGNELTDGGVGMIYGGKIRIYEGVGVTNEGVFSIYGGKMVTSDTGVDLYLNTGAMKSSKTIRLQKLSLIADNTDLR
jgi:hypothetical protein